jgi:hypothetical protein
MQHQIVDLIERFGVKPPRICSNTIIILRPEAKDDAPQRSAATVKAEA